jgi:hypothetical protein
VLRSIEGFSFVSVMALILSLHAVTSSASQGPEELLNQIQEYPHAIQIAFSQSEVVDHEIGLGAIQKVRGEWRFKHSERVSGTLLSYTWQIVDGFTSAEVMSEMLDQLVESDDALQLFVCNGRACGPGVQWANRVFNERVLYGRDDLQQYRAYGIKGDPPYRLVAFSASRTTDRQYLRVELLRISN